MTQIPLNRLMFSPTESWMTADWAEHVPRFLLCSFPYCGNGNKGPPMIQIAYYANLAVCHD